MDYIGAMWTGLVGWRCGLVLLEYRGLKISQLSEVLGFWPWFKLPRGREWLVALIVAFILPRNFIEPLFSGSVDWNFALDYAPASTVRSEDPTASTTKWYYYNIQGLDRKTALRRAGGMASIAWGATDSASSKGGSISAPGGLACRRLMPTTAPVNSTLANATLPCIYIQNITWSDDQPPDDVWEYAWSKTDAIGTFGDSLFAYVRPGVAVAFSQDLWTSNSTVKTDRKKGRVNLCGGFEMERQYDRPSLGRQTSVSCKPIYGTAFGNSSYLTKSLPGVFQANATAYDENCMVWGTVYFTAGEIQAPESVYIAPRVVEYHIDTPKANETISASRGPISSKLSSRLSGRKIPCGLCQILWPRLPL
ncbi:hypothetical protein FPANT_9341 [Fusarium pseudoanthophilum]|uniref:Uncharacterized protein n=1 Tax=Fusarium pseudoanthophilum TaxID=48495 RepID=A0A8H5KYH3_9HYPO|nr:hypothetical protein FPANT_9341 [Fusarium pseudoanthophilum]